MCWLSSIKEGHSILCGLNVFYLREIGSLIDAPEGNSFCVGMSKMIHSVGGKNFAFPDNGSIFTVSLYLRENMR